MSEGRINIIDATPIEAARSGNNKDKNDQPVKDPEAGWHVKKNSRGKQTSTYGFSVHTAVDEDPVATKFPTALPLVLNKRSGISLQNNYGCFA